MKKHKKTREIPCIMYEQECEIDNYFNANNLSVLENIYLGIELAVENNKKKALIVTFINKNNPNDIYDFIIDRSEWKAHLGSLMSNFCIHEAYEWAGKCKKLLVTILNK